MRHVVKYVTGILCIFLISLILISCAQKQPPVEDRTQTKNKTEKDSKQKTVNATAEDEKSKQVKKKTEKEQVEEYKLKEEGKKERKQERKLAKNKQKIRQRIHFAFDSYQLSSEARAKLKKKAELLEKYSDIKLTIEGHCDERGTEEYNLALGERRAKAAYEYLIILGIDPSRLSCVSYGEEKPLVEGHNEEAWAKNRRAEFVIEEDKD